MGGCVGWGVGQWASGHGWVGGWVDGWVHVWLCACGVPSARRGACVWWAHVRASTCSRQPAAVAAASRAAVCVSEWVHL